MFSNTILGITINIIMSIVFIYGIHSCWNYLKDTYSTKKTKDLVNIQIEKYKRIMNDMQKQQSSQPTLFENEKEKQNMNDDLLEFINQQTSTEN